MFLSAYLPFPSVINVHLKLSERQPEICFPSPVIDLVGSTQLKVRQGDELYQVARWHCHRHSLAEGSVWELTAKLEEVGSSGHVFAC